MSDRLKNRSLIACLGNVLPPYLRPLNICEFDDKFTIDPNSCLNTSPVSEATKQIIELIIECCPGLIISFPKCYGRVTN